MLGRIALTLPASASAVPVASAVAEGFAIEAGIARGDAARVAQAVRSAVGFSVDRSYGGRGGGDVELHLELDERGVTVDVHDWGTPMRRAGGEDGPLPAGLEEAEAVASDVRLINLADDGKRISLHVEAPHATPVVPVVDGAADDERGDRARALEDVGIRDGTVADADAIAELLYRGYALKYRHRDFYTPRWVEAAIAEGRVLSTVAYAEERLIGHHALLLEEPGEAAESGVAVIDRAWRGLGLFDPMFAHTVARARGVGIPAVFGRATCAHVYSQRSEFKHGYREAALLLGGSPAAMAQQQTEAGEGPARRGANLVSYLPVTGERARGIIPPAPYVDEVRRLISHIGLEPESAEQSPVPVPDQAVADPEDGTARLWLSGPADTHALDRALRADVARAADVLFADVDLGVESDAAVAALNERGFFFAGVSHAGLGGRDWLRLQRPQADVETERLQLEGETGRWLLERILADRDRVA